MNYKTDLLRGKYHRANRRLVIAVIALAVALALSVSVNIALVTRSETGNDGATVSAATIPTDNIPARHAPTSYGRAKTRRRTA